MTFSGTLKGLFLRLTHRHAAPRTAAISPTTRPIGSLIYILQSLDDEYDDVQGVPRTRYDHIVQQLTQPLIEALEAEFDPATRLLEKLNELHEAFFTL